MANAWTTIFFFFYQVKTVKHCRWLLLVKYLSIILWWAPNVLLPLPFFLLKPRVALVPKARCRRCYILCRSVGAVINDDSRGSRGCQQLLEASQVASWYAVIILFTNILYMTAQNTRLLRLQLGRFLCSSAKLILKLKSQTTVSFTCKWRKKQNGFGTD